MTRKPMAALAASVAVLAVAGVALAHGGGSPASVQPVMASFDTADVSKLKSDTCTGADGTYTRTHATYTGNSTSDDPRLNGKLTVRAKSVYNTTTNLGIVEGNFRVESDAGKTHGKFRAVNTAGALAGFADGKAKEPKSKLFANLSATFDAATGFSGGQLGSGSAPDTAVFASGSCEKEHGKKGEKGERRQKGSKHEKKNRKHGKKGKRGKKH